MISLTWSGWHWWMEFLGLRISQPPHLRRRSCGGENTNVLFSSWNRRKLIPRHDYLTYFASVQSWATHTWMLNQNNVTTLKKKVLRMFLNLSVTGTFSHLANLWLLSSWFISAGAFWMKRWEHKIVLGKCIFSRNLTCVESSRADQWPGVFIGLVTLPTDC